MKRVSMSTAVAAVTFAALFGAPAIAQTDVKIGFVTINDPQHDLAKRFAEELNKRSDGKLDARVFPSAQLGTIPRQLEGLQLGTQEVFLSPPGFLTGMNPAVQVPDAPGVFDSHDHAYRTLTHPEFYERYVKLTADKGIEMLNLWVYDGTSYASRTPIKTLDDLEGLKIRVLATEMESQLVGMFGAAGVPMPYSQVLAALQRRTLDACRSSIVVMGNSKFYTVTKNITVVDAGFIPSTIMVSLPWLNKQPEKIQSLVRTAAKDLEQWANENAKMHRDRAEELWKKNGATVYRFPDEDQKTYVEKIDGLGDIHLGQHKNAEVREMWTLLKKSAAATRK